MSITIREKDDSISWEQIRKLIFIAHSENRQNGLDIRNAHLSAEELQRSLGKNGTCFVALDGDKLVGTCSVAFKAGHFYFFSGDYAYLTLDAVHPDYKGQGIFQQLDKKRSQLIEVNKTPVAIMFVAQKNKHRRDIAKKTGFKEVEIKYNPYNSHNFIIYCKWIQGKETSTISIFVHYTIQRFILTLKTIKRKLTK